MLTVISPSATRNNSIVAFYFRQISNEASSLPLRRKFSWKYTLTQGRMVGAIDAVALYPFLKAQIKTDDLMLNLFYTCLCELNRKTCSILQYLCTMQHQA